MSSINSQVTDAGIQSGTLVLDQADSLSMANTFMAAANSIGLMMQNAVAVEQSAQMIAQASVATTCALIVANAGS